MPLPLLLPILSAVAPAIIERVLGDGEAAETARAVITEVTGIDVRTPEQQAEALARLQADAALAARLRARLAEVGLAETEAYLEDRADARARDVALTRILRRSNDRATSMLLAAFAAIIAITGGLIALNFFVTDENDRYIGTIVGFLTGVGGMFARNIGTAFDFEFGSSRGSKEKDRELAGIAAARPSAGAAAAAAGDALEAFRARLRG